MDSCNFPRQALWTACRLINEEALILDLRRRELLFLNKTGSKIWEMLDGSLSLEEISKKNNLSLDDVKSFVDSLESLKLLQDEKEPLDFTHAPESHAYSDKFEAPTAGNDRILKEVYSRVEKHKIPFFVLLELTHKCNLKCRHCYITPAKKKELSVDSIFNLLEELAGMGCFELTLSGGEPLLHPHFFSILRYARDKKFSVIIKTNGTLLNEETVEQMAEFFPTEIHLSIYSLNQERHDFITGLKGSLRKTLNSIFLLRKKGIRVKISSPITNITFCDYEEIKKFAASMGIRSQSDPVIIRKRNGIKKPLKFRMSKKELEIFYNFPSSREELKAGKLENYEYQENNASGDRILCRAGHCLCAISSYGEVFPCFAFPLKVGDFKVEKFSKIWNFSNNLNFLRTLRKKDLKVCSSCELLKYCTPCPGHAYLEEGDFLGKSDFSCLLAEIKSKIQSS